MGSQRIAHDTDQRPGAAEWARGHNSLPSLASAEQLCRGCELYRDATQAVPGEGKVKARFFFVGEQPGDQEDRKGRPFVGPAGRLLDKALEAAGVARSQVYVTNAVKHFRFTTKAPGKRRLHQKPDLSHLVACRPFVEEELRLVQPSVVVVLVATAARSLLGAKFRVTEHRGQLLSAPAAGEWTGTQPILATLHPSSVLRSQDREANFRALVDDLASLREVS